jgi:uncharacterized protein YecE (DUF72 family)
MRTRHPSSIRVGTAGWDYDDWKGVVYPRPRPHGFDPLRYLAGYIDLIEINSTFYRPPTAEVAKRWVDRVADVADFRFTAKLWRRFTHQRQEAWSVSDVEEARRGLDVLLDSGRLDAVLVQFPWSFRNDETNRGWLDDVSSTFPDYPLVVEVRHESWNVPGFHAWLVDSGIGFVNVDQPLFRSSIRPSAYVTAAAAYIRVHGRNYSDWFRKDAGRDARYDYLYERDELKPWVSRAKDVAAHATSSSVDVVFNNHYRGQAVVNALQFRSLLDGRRPDVPAPLAAAYPALV